jgi:hypothetical protein
MGFSIIAAVNWRYMCLSKMVRVALLIPAIVFAPRHFRSRLATMRPECAKRKQHFVEDRS